MAIVASTVLIEVVVDHEQCLVTKRHLRGDRDKLQQRGLANTAHASQ